MNYRLAVAALALALGAAISQHSALAQSSTCASQAQCLSQAKAARVSYTEAGASQLGTYIYSSAGQGNPIVNRLDPSLGSFLNANTHVNSLEFGVRSASINWTDTWITLGQFSTAIDPKKGFTILLVYQNEWNVSRPEHGIALSMLDGSLPGGCCNNGTLFSIGRYQNQWTFGRMDSLSTSTVGSSYWETPWDPRVTTPLGAWDWVYYTFTPDGKVRIDKFTGHEGFAFYYYDWQESVLDGGYPSSGFPAGTPTTNPAPLNFFPPSELVTGTGLDITSHQSYGTPTAPVPGFSRLDVFNIPFTRDHMIAYQKGILDSWWLPWGNDYPCNTGFWMKPGTFYTPCGSTGSGVPPSSVGGATPPPGILPPQNFVVFATSPTSVTVTWSPSLNSSGQVDSSIKYYVISGGPSPVYLTPAAACSNGVCTATITGLTAGQLTSFNIAANSPQGTSPPSSDVRMVPTVFSVGSGGTYPTLTAAFAALPATGGTVTVAPGTYHEKLVITQSNVVLMGTGTDASKVVITHNDSVYNGNDAHGVPIPRINPATGKAFSTSGTYTVDVKGDNFYATNLTIQNTANYEAPNFENNGQAVALMTEGDRSVFRAVMILGGQDTLYSNGPGLRSYYKNSYIEGYVDYIFGSGKTVFDGCLLKTKIHTGLNGEATITAQKRTATTEDDGFVITNSQLLFDDPYLNNVWLGRPWGAYSTTYFLNTKMGSQVVSPGWIEFIPLPVAQGGTNNLPTSTYREFGTLYPGATAGTWVPFAISQRESVSPKSNVALTAAEAAALSPTVYLQGVDGWNPTAVSIGTLTAQNLPLPTVPVGVPGKPLITSTLGGNGNIQIAWKAAPSNPVETAYQITAVQGGVSHGPMTFAPNASSGYISGLTNGTSATVTLVEINPKGTSASTQVSATPVLHDPSAPLVTSIAVTGTSATVNFTVQSEGIQRVWDGVNSHGIYFGLYASAANFYAGTAIAGTAGGSGATSPITSHTFTGLAPNTTYYVSLRAYNGWFSPTVLTPFTTAAH